MFGLESRGENGTTEKVELIFDLEEKTPSEIKELKERAHQNLHQLKGYLENGVGGKAFELVGQLIYGYAALLKVLDRITPQKLGKK